MTMTTATKGARRRRKNGRGTRRRREHRRFVTLISFSFTRLKDASLSLQNETNAWKYSSNYTDEDDCYRNRKGYHP